MDAAIKAILEAILTNAPGMLAVVGWALYMLERYYIAPAREKQHRCDIAKHQTAFKEQTEKTTEAILRFTTVLEIIKDRVGRT